MRCTTFTLLLLAAACTTGRSTDPQAAGAGDDFFTLPMTESAQRPAEPGIRRGAPREGEVGGYEVRLRLRNLRTGTLIQPMSLVVYPSQWASMQVGSQISFVQDFDVEVGVEAGSFIADPIVGTMQTGWLAQVSVNPVADTGLLRLTFGVDWVEVEQPIELRQATLVPGSDSMPVTFQLPRLLLAGATGATLVQPGLETVVARFDSPSGPVQVAARVEGVALPELPDPDVARDYVAENGIWDDWPEPDQVSARMLRVSLLRIDGLEPGRLPTRLQRGAAEGFRQAHNAATLKSFLIPADGRAAFEMQQSHVSAFTERRAGDKVVYDPEIDTVKVGFRASARAGALRYEWSSLTALETGSGGEDRPVVVRRRGALPLDAPVIVQPVAALQPEGQLVLLVETAPRLDLDSNRGRN